MPAVIIEAEFLSNEEVEKPLIVKSMDTWLLRLVCHLLIKF